MQIIQDIYQKKKKSLLGVSQSGALKVRVGTLLWIFFPSRASVIKEYGVYWDGINVTLNCKSSVLCFISLY